MNKIFLILILIIGVGIVTPVQVGNTPQITFISFPPKIKADDAVLGFVGFKDHDGNLVKAMFTVVQAKDFQSFILDPSVKGVKEGFFVFQLAAKNPQKVVLQLTLIDETGHRSQPQEFSFEVIKPRSPLRVHQDFSTIEQALVAALPGDTILIGPGTYSEHLVITKDVTLKGSGRGKTILKGFKDSWAIVQVTSNALLHVTLQDLTLTNAVNQASLIITGKAWATVHRVTISHSSQNGIIVQDQALLDVEDSEIVQNDGTGVIAFDHALVSIRNSLVSENRTMGEAPWPRLLGRGIALRDSSQAWIVGNRVTQHDYAGISLGQASRAIIYENILASNYDGIDIGYTDAENESSQIKISHNTIQGSWFCGVRVEEAEKSIQVIGEGNRFVSNYQDLCPPQYPWPPSFREGG